MNHDDEVWRDGDDTDDYSLLVPFTCLRSAGGELDDTAFVVGFILGGLNQAMLNDEPVITATIQTIAVGQLDLIAMSRAYVVTAATFDQAPEWSQVQLVKAATSEIPTTERRNRG